jgi:glycosyltransferase involved in cell wall biosynthesis
MKLLIFCPYYPPHIGGLESHADEFNKYLSQKGMDITVFTPRLPQDASESEICHNNVKIIRFPAFEIISNYPLPKFWLPKFWQFFLSLFEERFDIVISRTRFFNTSLLAFFYAKIKKVRWIHIEHGSDFVKLTSGISSFVAKIYDYAIGRLIFRYSDLNIAISKSVQKFIEKFNARDTPIIYRGIDQAKINSIQPNSEFKSKFKDKIILAWSGRLYKWKGVSNTIEAIAKLPEEVKNKIIFLIIGDGEDRKQLEKKSSKEVVFAGKLSREETIGLIKISDIYIHSSLPGGGLSTSLLEAMYCGCAIIATPYEGADEVIINNEMGILVEASDPKLITKKIEELINNKSKIQAMTSNAKEKVRELFLWEKSIDKYLKYIH